MDFKKSNIFTVPIVKQMNANYVEICRVSNLEADFQQIQQRKVKDKNSKQSLYYKNCIDQTNFWQ